MSFRFLIDKNMFHDSAELSLLSNKINLTDTAIRKSVRKFVNRKILKNILEMSNSLKQDLFKNLRNYTEHV